MGQTALITGASSGIGKELAIIHAKKGGDLILVARREAKLQELKTILEQQYQVNVTIIVKDLIQPNATKEVYDFVKASGLQVDYLINNAGFGGMGKFHERKWEDDLAMINLNVVALTSLTRFFLDDFVARNSGKILNVSSTAGKVPGPLQAVYYATKAFVSSFSYAISEELSDTNITVTALLPGPTKTEFGAISGMDKTLVFKKTANAEKVAIDGYKAMMSGKIDVVTGIDAMNNFMLTISPLLPKSFALKQVRKFQEMEN